MECQCIDLLITVKGHIMLNILSLIVCAVYDFTFIFGYYKQFCKFFECNSATMPCKFLEVVHKGFSKKNAASKNYGCCCLN